MAEAIQQQQLGLPLSTNVFLGATFDAVQGHYSKQWSNDSFEATVQDHRHYYQLQSKAREYVKKNFSCGPCNRSFFSQKQYKKHVDDHVKCPFPECSLSADMKVIDQHISHQHMLVNFEALQVDDEKWIADRKKRFPTTERAELRRAEQMERLKRGARIGLERKTLSNSGYKGRGHRSKFSDDRKTQTSEESIENKSQSTEKCLDSKIHNSTDSLSQEYIVKNKYKQQRKYKSLMEKKEAYEKNTFEVDLFDSDCESKGDIPAFKGMTEFFENSGELPLFGIKGSHVFEDIAISDDEDEVEWNKVSNTQKSPPKNALGLLIGNYSSDSEMEIDKEEQSSNLSVETNDTQKKSDNFISKESKETNQEKGDNNKSKERNYHKRRQRIHRGCTNDDQQHSSIRPSKPKSKIHNRPKRKRKPTLLERLLEPDIKRERNMILQCIRYIVNENYFENKTDEQQNKTDEQQNKTDEQQNKTDQQQNITDEQQNITNEQQNITDEQQNISDEQQNITDEKPNITDEQQNKTDEQQNETDEKQNETNELKNKTDEQQNITDEQQNITDEQQNITDEQQNKTDEQQNKD